MPCKPQSERDISDTEFNYLWGRRHHILFRVQLNRLYYQQRRSILERCEAAIKILTVMACLGGLSSGMHPAVVQPCMAAVVVFNVIAMAVGLTAQTHDSARRDDAWVKLERAIVSVGERGFTEVQLNDWSAQVCDVEAGEPAVNARIMARCFDRLCASLGIE